MTALSKRRVWHNWICDNCRHLTETNDVLNKDDGTYTPNPPHGWVPGFQSWSHWCPDCHQVVLDALAERVKQLEFFV